MAKTMQTSPMDPKVEAARQARAAAYATRQVQAKAEQREARTQAQAQAQSPDQARQAVSALLSGNRFYLSWTISSERRRELSRLIQSNGGEVLKAMMPGAVELVEKNSLKTGQTWVSVDFVYDLVRDQTLPDITQYMAEGWQTTASELSPGISARAKRRGRLAYTVEDDAKMLQFVNVTHHSAESMRERYRKVLTKYTPLERRNIMKHAKDEDDARQRRELSAINANAASPTASTETATAVAPVEEMKSTSDVVSSDTQASESTTAESQVAEEAKNASASGNGASEEKTPVPAPTDGEGEAKEQDDGDNEEEEIQGCGKKRVRKSVTVTAQQKTATPNKTDIPSEEAVVDAEDPQEPTAVAPAAESEPVGDSADMNSNQEKKPKMSSKKQQKQKLKRNVAPPQVDEEEEETSAEKTTELTEPAAVVDIKKKARSTFPPVSPPAREAGTPGVFFRSRWEQLINDTSNRQQLQQYFNRAHPQEASTAPTPAVRGRNLRKLTPDAHATIETTPTQVGKNDDETATTTGGNATPIVRRRKRAAAEAEEEGEKGIEKETMSTKPAPSKKQKVSQVLKPQKTAPAPVVPTTVAVAAARSQVAVRKAQAQVEEAVVTSKSEVDSLTCQLQFATDQELNTVTHALYYSSGDVEVALSFLQGACPADFWSEEDDLLLADLMSDATDVRKVADARRQGAFASMGVQRTAAQILTRIRYLL